MSGTEASLLETELGVNPAAAEVGSNVTVRPMAREDRTLVHAWAAQEGWNPGNSDADILATLDSNGLLLCTVDGKAAGCIGASAYSHTYGFIGLYIVQPEYRGQGVGAALWRAAFNHLGKRNIAIDGDPGHRSNYEAYGFKPVHGIRRFQGRGGGHRPVDAVDLRVFSFERVVHYDGEVFGAERPIFLDRWTHQDGATSVGVINTRGVIAGYGTVRPCKQGFRIGPLFANRPEDASHMMDALLAAVSDQPVFMDVPANNPDALAVMDAHNFAPIFETERLYTGGRPVGDPKRTYALTGFMLA